MQNQIEATLRKRFLKITKWVKRNIASTIIIIIFTYILLPILFKLPENHQALGPLGDFIGGVLNPIIAAFALYFLVQSFKMQKKELADLKTHLQKQSSQIDAQNFENLFFQLLNTKDKILKDLSIDLSLKTYASNYSKNDIYIKDAAQLKELKATLKKLEEINKGHEWLAKYWQAMPNETEIKVEKNNLNAWFKAQPNLNKYFEDFFKKINQIRTQKNNEWEYYVLDLEFFYQLLALMGDTSEEMAKLNEKITELQSKITFFSDESHNYLLKLQAPNSLPSNDKVALIIGIFELFYPESWLSFWKNYTHHFMQQYLNLHLQILLLIYDFEKKNNIDYKNSTTQQNKLKVKYVNIYASQLTQHEMKFLYWSAYYGSEDNVELKIMLDALSLFKHFPKQNQNSHYYHYCLHKI